MGKRREKAAEMPSIVKVAKKTPEEPKTGKATEGIKDALVELIRLLIHRADVIAWLYDGSADMLYFRSPEDDFLRRAKDFSVSSWEDSWAFLWHGDMSGSVDAPAPFGHEEAVYRLDYRRTMGTEGAYVVGLAEDITEAHAAAARLKDGAACSGKTELSGDKVIRLRVEAELQLLHPGEKGVLFAIEIDDFNGLAGKKEACIRVMEDTLRAEFRGNDVFGRMSRKGRYIVFFCGLLSIDVVERRAQHFLDEFRRKALDTSVAATCSLGIAVAGGDRSSSETLISAACATLDEALVRGSHHFRMFDSNRY